MNRFLGRLFTGTTTHLIQIAALLDFTDEGFSRMHGAEAEECEAIFLREIEGRFGSRVDWRGSAADIYDILDACSTDRERRCLPPLEDVPDDDPAEVVAYLDAHLEQAPRALRALDSFGDFMIVLLIPRDRLSAFEHAAGRCFPRPRS
jgi:hypothetical protein